MANGATIALANVEKPVEDVVVVFSVETDFVGAVEERSCFFMDGAACVKEI